MKKVFKLAGEITIEGLKQAQKDLNNFEKRTKKAIVPLVKFGRQAENLGKQFTASLTLPITAAGAAMFKFTQDASDLGETISKSGELFGESAKDIEAWAETSATAIGQSKTQAIDAAANFAIFAKSAGKTGDDLVKFSTKFTELASDLASFNNTSPEEAITAIGAALRGEAEPIRKYGILLDDASLRQKALELGIIDTIKNALTPQQKVLAAGELIMEQSITAQGDFARTSGGLANQQRILTAELQNAATKLGEAFLPIVLKLVDLFRSKFIPRIKDISKWLKNMDKDVLETRLKLLAMVAALGPLLLSIGKFIGLIKLLPAAIGAVKLAMVALNSTLLSNPFTIAIAGIVALGAAIVKLQKKYDKLKEAHNSTLEIMTKESAKRNEFSKEVEDLNKKIKQSGINISNAAELESLYGEEIDKLAVKASELNYTLAAGSQERYIAINTINAEIKGVREISGELVKYNNVVKTVKQGKKELTEEEIKSIDELKNTTQQYYEILAKIEQQRLDIEKNNANARRTLEENTLADLTQLNNKYRALTADTTDEKIQLLIEARNDELWLADALGADKLQIEEYYQGEIDKLRKEDKQKEKDALLTRLNDVNSYAQQAIGIFQGLYNNQAIEIDNNYKRDKERIENTITNEKEKTAALEKLDDEYNKNRSDLAKKQAIADKAGAIFSIGINTASAIIEALPNLFLSGLIGALGAAQAAIVASKPIPAMAEGGVVKATTGGTLVKAAEAGEDEGFIPMTKGTASIANAIIDNMNRQTGLTNGLAAGTSLTSTTPISFHIGTFIGDDSGIKELTRRIIPYITIENRRKGIVS